MNLESFGLGDIVVTIILVLIPILLMVDILMRKKEKSFKKSTEKCHYGDPIHKVKETMRRFVLKKEGKSFRGDHYLEYELKFINGDYEKCIFYFDSKNQLIDSSYSYLRTNGK